MKRKIAFLLFIASTVPLAFSAQLDDLVEPVYASQLRSGGASVTQTQLKNPALKLLPNSPELRQFISDITSALDPNLAVETLYLYKKPPAAEDTDFFAYSDSWSEEQRIGLFNKTLAVSTLAGIEYYSASRKKMRVFYEISTVIDRPETKKPLPDPVYTQLPASLTFYARQKDLTFGDNIYRYEYKTSRDALFFSQENITALNAGIIPAIGKSKLRSVMAIIDCGDSLLIYAVSLAKAVSIPGMGDRIGDSFGNRAEAILKWFTGKADSVFLMLF